MFEVSSPGSLVQASGYRRPEDLSETNLAGTLIFRHTHLESASELGVNCVAEAGARLMKEGQLLSGQAGLGDRDLLDQR